MANTRALVEEVERFIREWLRKKYRVGFTRKRVPVGNGAFHQFGAVSDDGTIVVAIRRLSGMTRGDNLPSGKIQAVFKDLHLLSLVNATHKALVLTDREFLQIVRNEMRGTFPSDVELLHCQLPPNLEAIVQKVRKSATEEMDQGTTRGNARK